jgi:hypothetical protein
MGETGRVASTTTGILTARVTPEIARRSWPGWLALGVGMVGAGVAGVLWHAGGARLLLAAVGLLLAGRGVQELRGPQELRGAEQLRGGRVRVAGIAAVVAGIAGIAVAAVSATAAGRVLVVGVPVLLLGTASFLLRGRSGRRSAAALLVWAVLVTGLLAVAGIAQGWSRAVDVATVVTGLAVAAMGVPLLLGAVNLRAVAAAPAPERPAACAGCACGAGGCGALG